MHQKIGVHVHRNKAFCLPKSMSPEYHALNGNYINKYYKLMPCIYHQSSNAFGSFRGATTCAWLEAREALPEKPMMYSKQRA
ncbi:unnamed protein product [Periconia digitata]|uniref:Uncharacterized protein n=1 Tax=Periconia digitata TaxID=1303443 RepID=A0A9W4XMK6_9PLEO|nr:unnamed protein product [Periconia digitata]